MPWIHMHSIPSGDVMGCCVWKTGHWLGNVKQQTIDEIATGEPMNDVRRRMMAGERLTECDSCNLRQDSNPDYVTHRRFYNHQYQHLIKPLTEQTNPDGSINYEFKLRSMNLRFSNLCNYSCRSCGPKYSSLWAQEEGTAKPVINVVEDNPDYLEQILEHLPWVEYINFTGGESLLTDEHWTILERLVELGKTDVDIDFYTNVSRLEYRGRSLVTVARQLGIDKFKVRVSLDASHERAELYRNGTVWSTVERNLKTLVENDINVVVNCTVGAANIWHAPDLHRYLIENGLIKTHYEKTVVNPWVCTNLVYPPVMRSTILPPEYKLVVKDKIQQHIQYLDSRGIDSRMWNTVIQYMMSRDDSEMIPEFIQYNNEIDIKRGQRTVEVFPELAAIGQWPGLQ